MIFGIALARILSPSEFGIMAMITVLTNYAQLFQNFGFGASIVQKKTIHTKDLSTVFYLQILLSSVICLILYSCRNYIASFYNQSILSSLIILVCIGVFIRSLNIIQYSLLIRDIKFKKLFFINLISISISSLCALYFALKGYGVWALAYKYVLLNLILNLLYWFTSNWSPRFVFSRQSLNHVINYSVPLFGSYSLNYWARNLHKLLVGKIYGDSLLGIYNRPFRLILSPINQLSISFTRVLFPTMSKRQHDLNFLRQVYFKSVEGVTYIILPLMIWIGIFSEEIIQCLLGQKWVDAVPFLRIFSVMGIFISYRTIHTTVFRSIGKTSKLFRLTLITKVLTITSVLLSIYYSIYLMAIIYIAAEIISEGIIWQNVLGELKTSTTKMLVQLWKIIICAIISSMLLLFLKHIVLMGYSAYLILVLTLVLGSSIYFFLSYILGVPLIKSTLKSLR